MLSEQRLRINRWSAWIASIAVNPTYPTHPTQTPTHHSPPLTPLTTPLTTPLNPLTTRTHPHSPPLTPTHPLPPPPRDELLGDMVTKEVAQALVEDFSRQQIARGSRRSSAGRSVEKERPPGQPLSPHLGGGSPFSITETDHKASGGVDRG